MPIVKYPEYSVEIVVKEGTGEITTANFSATVDPMSTSNMVLMKKKNRNLKPFIWGVSKWSDGDYNYMQNTYKGISTIGSGKNAVITLTFSQPVDHFTLYFDEVAQSMPLSVTVGDKTFSNDDYQFTYSQETTQTTFTITVNEINTINGVEMPLMITGIENRIALDITHRTGLRKLRTGHTYTKDKGKPAYGIISQEGALDIFDFYTEVDDLIELGLLDSKMNITVKFQDNVVGKYTSDKWTEQQTGLFSVSLNDKLMEWQNIIVPKKYELELDKTAKDLYNHLKSMTDLEFVLDTTTDNHLQAIQIKYYYWEESTLWDAMQKLCDLAQLYIYVRNDGKVVVVSQHRINELKTTNENNPIIIPYSCIDGQPQVNRLEKNKITKIEVDEHITTHEVGEVLNTSFVVQDSLGAFKIQNSTVENAEIVDYIHNGQTFKRLQFIQEITNTNYIISDLPFTMDSEKKASITYTESKTLNSYGSSSGDIMGAWISKDEYDFNDNLGNCVQLNKHTSINSRCYALYHSLTTNQSVEHNDFRVQFIVKANKYFFKKQELSVGTGEDLLKINSNEFFNTETKIDNVKISEYNANQILANFTGKQTISFRMATDNLYLKGGGFVINNISEMQYMGSWFKNEYGVNFPYMYSSYSLDVYTGFITLKNKIENFDDIKNNIYSNLYYMNDGLLGEFNIVADEISDNEIYVFGLYKEYESKNINDYKICNLQLGETLQVYDIIQLKKTDGTYDPKIWQISKVEHEVGGSNWLNIEAVEI